MSFDLDIFGRVYDSNLGKVDACASLLYTADGKRAEQHVVTALNRLGLPVRSIGGLLDVPMPALEAAVEKEAARVATLLAAEKKRRADSCAEADARVAEFDKARRDYAKHVIPTRRAMVEKMAALAGDAPEFADFVEVLRELAELPLEVTHLETLCRSAARDMRDFEASPMPSPYPEDGYKDPVAHLIPNALNIVSFLIAERKRDLVAKAADLKAQLQHLGVSL